MHFYQGTISGPIWVHLVVPFIFVKSECAISKQMLSLLLSKYIKTALVPFWSFSYMKHNFEQGTFSGNLWVHLVGTPPKFSVIFAKLDITRFCQSRQLHNLFIYVVDAAPQLIIIFMGPVGDLAKLVVFWDPQFHKIFKIFTEMRICSPQNGWEE